MTKRYGPTTALDHVTLSIAVGEAVGYLGPNGAGKTTTMKLLSGLTRPNSGEVSVAGHDVQRETRAALSSLGVLVETPGVLPYMHGRDLLLHVAEVKGIPLPERPLAARRASEELGVAGELDRPLGGLSTGLLRRVLLASALVGDPEILLLDEPTLGLDPAARADIRALLQGLNRRGKTLFLSTHIIEDVEEVCGRVVFLRDGKVAGDEPVRRESGTVSGERRVRVRMLSPAPPAEVTRLLAGRATVESRSEREIVLRFLGGDEAQSEVLGTLVTGGLRVVETQEVLPDLAARYMARVGREEGP